MRRRLRPPTTIWHAIALVAISVVSLVVLAAALIRVAEPETFASYETAIWWAVTTVTTVGYGDIVPASRGGRAIAAVVMIAGMSIVPTVSAIVVSALLRRDDRAHSE